MKIFIILIIHKFCRYLSNDCMVSQLRFPFPRNRYKNIIKFFQTIHSIHTSLHTIPYHVVLVLSFPSILISNITLSTTF